MPNDFLINYTGGRGIDLSRESVLKNARHSYSKPTNLFFLKNLTKPESLDFIYIKGISETKFHRLIFKEMLNYCKVGGYLIIEYGVQELLKYLDLKKEILLCAIEEAELVEESKKVIILKKTKEMLKNDDSIDKWTFGIITNGRKNEWVENQISSIKKQKIPNYEIIVCGTYYNRDEENFKYIQFNEKDDLGWITKKKNIICENAKYENLVIIHDRIILNDYWYQGMKKYGNYFEVLSCIIKDKEGNRAGDWITYGNWYPKFPRVGLLEYYDWDKMGCLDGGLCIIKKSIWKNNRWNENLFWNQSEDAELSHRWYRHGIVTRFNPHASCLTLSWRHGSLPIYEFDSLKLEKFPYRRNKLKDIMKFYIKKILGNKTKKYINRIIGK